MEVFFQTLGHYLKLEAYKPCPFVVKKMINYWLLARLGLDKLGHTQSGLVAPSGPFGCPISCSLLLCLLGALFSTRELWIENTSNPCYQHVA